MTVKIVTCWSTLITYAHELGQAKLSGNKYRIQDAQALHDNYRDICLKADYMILDKPTK